MTTHDAPNQPCPGQPDRIEVGPMYQRSEAGELAQALWKQDCQREAFSLREGEEVVLRWTVAVERQFLGLAFAACPPGVTYTLEVVPEGSWQAPPLGGDVRRDLVLGAQWPDAFSPDVRSIRPADVLVFTCRRPAPCS